MRDEVLRIAVMLGTRCITSLGTDGSTDPATGFFGAGIGMLPHWAWYVPDWISTPRTSRWIGTLQISFISDYNININSTMIIISSRLECARALAYRLPVQLGSRSGAGTGEWLVVAGTPAAFRTCRSQPPRLHDITCFRPTTSFSLQSLHSPCVLPLVYYQWIPPFLVLTRHPLIVR